jgi:uncharacterized protein YheU (UPF0270 family)
MPNITLTSDKLKAAIMRLLSEIRECTDTSCHKRPLESAVQDVEDAMRDEK